jgi:hypothetical protein
MKPLICILLAAMIFWFSGCMIFWTDQVFVLSLFKTIDANEVEVIVEPNYVQIGSGNSRTNNDTIKLRTIIGGVPVSLESESTNKL